MIIEFQLANVNSICHVLPKQHNDTSDDNEMF